MSNRLFSRPVALALALGATGAALPAIGAALATAASSAPAGGSVRVLATSSGNGKGGNVLLTGAVGDRGTTRKVNKAGKPDANGNYVRLSLSKGTFELNVTKIDAAANRAFSTLKVDSATCSASAAFSGPATVMSGTGLYKGITGKTELTVSYGFILPRFTSGAHAGQCNEGNSATPTAGLQVVQGAGTVSFT
jgi:hypothetical protein